MSGELWKQLIDYPNYYVSNLGNVKNKYEKILKPHNNGLNYYQVSLYKNNKSKTYYIHRLVALCFLDNYDDKLEIDHIDRDKSNNKVSNLRNATRSQQCINKNKKSNTYSKYIGVTYDKLKQINPWKAAIRINGVKKYIGSFDTEEEAYQAYKLFIITNNLDVDFRDIVIRDRKEI